MRGIIEGFYGPPWSHEDRLSMVRWLSLSGLDSYVYAPKSDPLHRGVRWTQPYPEDALGRFEELIAAGREVGVDVTIALAPARVFGRNNISSRGDGDGDGINDVQASALHTKLEALQDRGCRSFALLFDDTASTFVPALGGANQGRFHGRVARVTLDRLRDRHPDTSLFVVPSQYFRTWQTLGGAGRAYWSGLAEELSSDVPVAWTGPKIFSRAIRGDEILEISRATGLRLVVWNNAVVNDWLNLATGAVAGLKGWRKLSFAPPANMDAAVLQESAGVLLNGALEPNLTRVSAGCLGDFARAPLTWEPAASHAESMAVVAGQQGADVLDRIYGLVRNHLLMAPKEEEAPALFEAARRADREAVRGELEAIAGLERDAADLLPPALFDEVAPTVRKARLLAEWMLHRRSEARAQAKEIRWFVARRPFDATRRLH